jgi:hypothetical protein
MGRAMTTGDDQVIGTAFRRSLFFIIAIAAAAGLFLLGRTLFAPAEDSITDAELIAPQATDASGQPEPPDVRFTDVTREAGIHFVHNSGAYGDRLLPETMGGGIAVLDYDNDGAADLLFTSGKSWPWRDSSGDQSSLVLYRGDGTGRFSNVTGDTGLESSIMGMGAAVGDYDGDGYSDIFVTAVGANRLYRNIDGQRFEDVTDIAGVAGADDAWSTGAAFLDYDNDGDLDLVALNYVEWSRDIDLEVDYQLTGIGRAYGPPTQYAGTHSYLYRNDGDGSFSDVSASAGLQVENPATGLPLGKGLAVLPTDMNADGWTDLIVANDTVQNFLFVNRDGQGFEEVGAQFGLAFDNSGAATGAMGIDGARFGPDQAVAIGNFANEMTSLYVRPDNSRVFTDQAIVTGVGPASRQALTFGLFFFDYDLDGRLDLLQANGHVENEINVVQPSQQYAQAPQLFWQCGDACARQFIPVALPPDSDLGQPVVGRGAAYADIDGDGDQDVIITQIDAAPRVLRNDQATGNNWIQFDVRDEHGASAYGATVRVTGGRLDQQLVIEPTRSYLSQVDTVLTFGLGNLERVQDATVHWPDGHSVVIRNPAVNRRHRVTP